MPTRDDELAKMAAPATTQQIARAFIDFHRTRDKVLVRLANLKVAIAAEVPEEVADAMIALDGAANVFTEHCHAYSRIAGVARDSWIRAELDFMVQVVRGGQGHAALWLVTQCNLGTVHPTFEPYLRAMAADRLGSRGAGELAQENATTQAQVEHPTDSAHDASLRRDDQLVHRSSIGRRFVSWCRRVLRFFGWRLWLAQDGQGRSP